MLHAYATIEPLAPGQELRHPVSLTAGAWKRGEQCPELR